MKPLIINVGKSKTLSKAVQELLFGAGYFWKYDARDLRDHNYLYVNPDDKKLYSSSIFRDPIQLNAATEFGKLVELLETPPEIKIKLENSEAIIKDGGVQIGCKWASKDTVGKVREAMVGDKGFTKLAIKVNGSKALNRIVQELLFSFGHAWPSDKSVHERIADYPDAVIYNYRTTEKGIDWDDKEHFAKQRGIQIINAATEMGRLIELLEGSGERKMVLQLGSSGGPGITYDATNQEAMIRDGKITCLGVTATREQVEEIWQALQ